MKLSSDLVLDEAALNVYPVAKRPLFVFEYLRHLDQLLLSVDKVTNLIYTVQPGVDLLKCAILQKRMLKNPSESRLKYPN